MNRLIACALFLLAMAVMLGTPRAARAAESYDNCTGFINSVPAIISTQGTWCLKKDLTTAIASGAAITIATNNVTIDCNDFKLGGLPAGTGTQTFGIYAEDRSNATVRHCNIRGFWFGLYFSGSDPFNTPGGHSVEDNRFDGNTQYGILVYGDGSIIRRNRVLDTGGSTVGSSAAGIVATDNVDVIDNTVSGVAATSGSNGSATGIGANSNPNDHGSSSVSGNRVRNLLKAGTGHIVGINVDMTNPGLDNLYNHVVLSNNDVAGNAGAGNIGIDCDSSNGRAKDNIVSGFTTGFDTCSDDSGNVVSP
jgi:hypothetical protein